MFWRVSLGACRCFYRLLQHHIHSSYDIKKVCGFERQIAAKNVMDLLAIPFKDPVEICSDCSLNLSGITANFILHRLYSFADFTKKIVIF